MLENSGEEERREEMEVRRAKIERKSPSEQRRATKDCITSNYSGVLTSNYSGVLITSSSLQKNDIL